MTSPARPDSTGSTYLGAPTERSAPDTADVDRAVRLFHLARYFENIDTFNFGLWSQALTAHLDTSPIGLGAGSRFPPRPLSV